MENLLHPEICWRVSKEPFLPDYHIRFNNQLAQARELVHQLSGHSLVKHVIDLNKLSHLLEYQSTSSRLHTQHDFNNFLIIPRTIYLAQFLSSFS
jgi:hypothetical protein